eukprot:g23967.t1
MDSLMIGLAFALLSEGFPPTSIWWSLMLFFGLTLASASCLFLTSIWFVMKVQSIMSRYDLLQPATIYSCNGVHKTFFSFYSCHCAKLASCARLTYYLGCFNLFTSAAIVMFARFVAENWRAPEAAFSFAAIMAVTCLVLCILSKCFPSGPMLTEADYEAGALLRLKNGRDQSPVLIG